MYGAAEPVRAGAWWGIRQQCLHCQPSTAEYWPTTRVWTAPDSGKEDINIL